MTQVPPEDPPVYAENHRLDSLDLAHYDEERLLDQYDPVAMSPSHTETNSGSRLAKLTRWKQLLVDPTVEFYRYLELRLDRVLSTLGNPLIVKRLLYVLVISLVFYVLSFTGVFLTDGSGSFGFSDHDELMQVVSVDYKLLEESLEYLTSVDHLAGTSGDLAVAQYVHAAMRQNGDDTLNALEMQEMRSLMNFANKSTVEYVGADDKKVVLDVSEQFNPLSFNGEAEGDLVYLNHGHPSELKKLVEDKVEIRDKIGIITIDESIPVSQTALLAQQMGLKGLIFVDKDEGDYSSSYQRISMAIPEFYTGDPLTPGWSTSTISTRLKQGESSLLRIPTISLSRDQVAPLMQNIKENNKNIRVKLSNNVVYKTDHSIWNILGKIDGREQGEKALLIGVQRDSVCPNGINPNSGTSILIQLIKILNDLKLSHSWKPLRSIYFLSFDATEYNFAGATELVEAKSREIDKEAIAYIDLSGELMTNGEDLEIFTSGLLLELLELHTKDGLNHTVSITDRFQSYDNFIPFMNLGIPVIKPHFKRREGLNDYKCQSQFKDIGKIDPSYKKHATIIHLLTRLVLAISDDPLIPFDVTKYVDSLDNHLKSIQSIITTRFPNMQVNYNALLGPLLRLKRIGKEFEMWENAWKKLVSDDSGIEPSLLSVHRWSWNTKLNGMEKSMKDINGGGVSKSRRWFRNLISGPALIRPEGGDEVDWFSFPSIRDVLDTPGVDKAQIEAEFQKVGDLITKGCDYLTS